MTLLMTALSVSLWFYLVFRDPSMNPKWSFARINEEGLVIEVAEKNPISDLATIGIYLFARGKDFVISALDMIVANDRVNGEFYMPVYNYDSKWCLLEFTKCL